MMYDLTVTSFARINIVDEPSVLDYLRHLIKNWRHLPELLRELKQTSDIAEPASPLPQLSQPSPTAPETLPEPSAPTKPPKESLFPFSTLVALIFALLAQRLLEPPNPNKTYAIFLYAFTALALINALRKKEISLPELSTPPEVSPVFKVNPLSLAVGVIFAALAFLAFGEGDFTGLNLTLWFVALLLTINAFHPVSKWGWGKLWQGVKKIRQPAWTIQINRWTVFLVIAAGVVLFFRFYRLDQVPPEMVSDHAEKLLDVHDVLSGQWHIFYPRNTGREAFQMFLTAAMAKLFGTGLSFLSLKLGTAIAGLLIFPYIYLLGKEIGNERAGLFAMLLTGTSYWLNVITRVALRFSLYPLFVAPTLYYLIRGIRHPNPKDFILAGFFLGLGLHGYSPFRIVPLVVLVAVGLALLHRSSPQTRRAVLIGLMILILISVMVFLPLLRYAIDHPDQFSYRALTRLSDLEKPLEKPALQIFFSNLWKAMIMFFWDNGGVWVVSIPGRPALSIVSAALLFIGVCLILHRYARRRNWVDIFLLISIPLLMLPSILSLAFPEENPILNRTSGAIIPVFLLIGLGLDALLRTFSRLDASRLSPAIGWFIAFSLLFLAISHDYDLTFHQYQDLYTRSAWNTSEMGKIIREFADTVGKPDSAWVVAYPYWVDTRLVGVNAGYPTRDYAIWPDQFGETLPVSGPKLFILNPQDQEGMSKLQQMYPNGSMQVHPSPLEGKTFYIYFVPPAQTQP